MGTHGKRQPKGESVKKEKHKWTEQEIQRIIRYGMFSPNALKYLMENLIVFNWESDSLMVTKSGYYYEYEIKISRQDFRNDKKKKDKHLMLEGEKVYNKWSGMEKPRKCPNYFSYVVPEGLIKEEDVPSYAGLYYVNESGTIIEVKHPPRLHSEKWTDEQLGLTKKFYYNYIHWKEQRELDIEKMQEQLNEAKTADGKRYKYTLPKAIDKINSLEKIIDWLSNENQKYKEDYYDLQREYRKLLRGDEKNNKG